MKTAFSIPFGKKPAHRVPRRSDPAAPRRGAILLLWALLAAPWPGSAVTPHFFRERLMPPPDGQYAVTGQLFAAYRNNVVIRNAALRQPTQSVVPAPSGAGSNIVHVFSWQMELELSTDGGSTFTPCAAAASATLRLTFNRMESGREVYSGELLQLDVQPVPGLMIRENPELASAGETRIQTVAGGDWIDSFFDVYTQVSTDFGLSWWSCIDAGRVELRQDAALTAPAFTPQPLQPMPNGQYRSPPAQRQCYANGVMVQALRDRLFTLWSAMPPLNASTSTSCEAQSDLLLSTDGGATWQARRAPGSLTVTCKNLRAFAGESTYENEVTSLTVAGGDLPSNVMIRESPTLPSGGAASLTAALGGGYNVSSFFDIFTELSTDSGASWWPATNGPARAELCRVADAHAFESELQPTPCGQYVAAAAGFARYASGIVISNLACRAFSASYPPPLPGQTAGFLFSSEVELLISYDYGASYHHVFAPGLVNLQSTGRTAGGNPVGALSGGGTTLYYDTEMLQLDVSGGGLTPGVMIRESPTRASLGRTTATSLDGGGYQVDSFFDIYTEVSTDGGQSWTPTASGPGTVMLYPPDPLVVTCPSNITVRAASRAGAVVSYPAPTATGGCPPVTVLCAPPSGSLFPLGTTLVSCLATDICDHATGCTFTVTVLRPLHKRFFRQTALPPPDGMYFPPVTQTVHFANGLMLRAPAHRLFSASVLPPAPPGAKLTHAFSSQAEGEVSPDGGVTWIPFTANADAQVYIVNNGPDGSDTLYGTELLALDISGGTLPPNVRIRESPTLASLGETRVQALAGGYLIDSFFDIFTEVSVDSGLSWSPALEACAMELKPDPALVDPAAAPQDVLPMPNGQYLSPGREWQSYANGVLIMDMRNKLFTDWAEPPAFGASRTNTFDSQLDFLLSMDGGATWNATRAPGTMAFTCRNVRDFSGQTTYEAEVTTLHAAGGGLPAGVMIRESPTKASEGGLWLAAEGGGGGGGGGSMISSFFDVFTEVSTDSGMSWWTATNGPARIELERVAPADAYAADTLPPSQSRYVHRQPWFALYPSGVILSNVIPRLFTASFTPPLPGDTDVRSLGAQVEMEASPDGGATWGHASAPADITLQITARLDGDGVTTYYDTEVTQFDVSGGTLPSSMRIRESPTKASLGRITSSSLTGGGYQIDSFFDIYTEVSTDGGLSWFETAIGPATLTLEPDLPLAITCYDIAVLATNWNGRIVSYPPPEVSGGLPPVALTCDPPSGSFFPVGATLVTCEAVDAIGQATTNWFTVKVVRAPENDLFPFSVARLKLQLLTGGTERIDLVGPSRMEVYVGPDGKAGDSDGNGRDDATAELAELALRGFGATQGPVLFRLAPAARTAGLFEEQVNNSLETLDVPPFAVTGQLDSFFDVYAEIEVGGQVLHPSVPFRIVAQLDHKPPLPGETFAPPQPLSIPLLNAAGKPSGLTLTGFAYTPATTVEIDTFPRMDSAVTLRLPSGGTEIVRLTGSAVARVYFEGSEGQAADHDSDGRDDTIQELAALHLEGLSSDGPLSLDLAPERVSLGELEERANSTPGLLDVPPFAPSGDCDSFFDVFFNWTIGGQLLHNADPWRLSGVITHKPAAAGEALENLGGSPVDLLDEEGRTTLGRMFQQWLVSDPPLLAIAAQSNTAVKLSWPTPSTGYQLQSCSNLPPPSAWLNVTNAPVLDPSGLFKWIQLETAASTNRFFKLRRTVP